jgi:hypothetical protein
MGHFWIERIGGVGGVEKAGRAGRVKRIERSVGFDDRPRRAGIGRAERERIFWERVASGRRAVEIRDNSAASGAWESIEMAIATLLTVVIFGLGWVAVELGGAEARVGYDLASLEPIGMSRPPTATPPISPISPIWPKAAGSQRTESTDVTRKGPR